ncbi:hypothetical protein CBOM_00081 [Ceraceosorus bombacis]|uniref:Uncharacterized protein n=1 Tax=Ceraceosorus bombacis TaxID=401625 RepID=A0A0P1B812_9BASI|nr:hypothetical protein CBOM_00081 [Ceraceosorus bombacis]
MIQDWPDMTFMLKMVKMGKAPSTTAEQHRTTAKAFSKHCQHLACCMELVAQEQVDLAELAMAWQHLQALVCNKADKDVIITAIKHVKTMRSHYKTNVTNLYVVNVSAPSPVRADTKGLIEDAKDEPTPFSQVPVASEGSSPRSDGDELESNLVLKVVLSPSEALPRKLSLPGATRILSTRICHPNLMADIVANPNGSIHYDLNQPGQKC